ncbi:hypothetical protein PN441_20130 [Spirulina major CS-329]|uniref:hypothetical protein n=1 Tax=Spirulina TaxID=1154 RepID=UPI00232E24D4|nr:MULTISPECIES: hypothetical protein [Spirulina]MDB9493812.1 hypothetical protein [Spirulina subsalsa CS-330]MDB9505394.1 hypothetical protein [Spirulina major CS-329]
MAYLKLLHLSNAQPSIRPSGCDRTTLTLQVHFKPRELRHNCDYGIHGVLYPAMMSPKQSSRCCVVMVHFNPQECRYGWGRWFPCGWARPHDHAITQVQLPPAIRLTANIATIPAQLVLMASQTSPVFNGLTAIAS